jgi:hypothetical protein
MKIIFERARDIIMKPKETWLAIKGESAVEIKQLMINYAAPLALIPAVASLIGMSLIGMRIPAGGMMRAPFLPLLIGGVLRYVLGLASLLIGAWIVKLLAPAFNSKADLNLAFKLVVYSMTPVWLVGIFSLIPGFGILMLLGLYGIYLLVLGMPALLETPPDKVALFTITILVVGLVVNVIISMAVMGIYGPIYMRMMAV